MNAIFTVIFIASLLTLTITAPENLLPSLLSGAKSSLTMAMTLSDYLCRCHVNRNSTPSRDARETLRLPVTAEGMESCSLEQEEANAIFEKTYTYMNRIFNHSGVQSIARNFAEHLASSRSLDHADIVELLDTLRML